MELCGLASPRRRFDGNGLRMARVLSLIGYGKSYGAGAALRQISSFFTLMVHNQACSKGRALGKAERATPTVYRGRPPRKTGSRSAPSGSASAILRRPHIATDRLTTGSPDLTATDFDGAIGNSTLGGVA